jgi:membrane-bound serine protease (ClpP class)
VDVALDVKGSRTQRPDLRSPEHAGRYREVAYVTDGQGLVTLKAAGMRDLGIAADVVRNDAALKGFFGASSMARLDQSWSVGLVRFLRNPIVMGFLLVVFLLSAFIEMTHPGVILPGSIAAVCLVALVVPPLLVDLAAWWSVGAIALGIVCLGVEIFLIPGFGFVGVLGIILLFGGLIGIFVGGPSGLFPTTPRGRDELAYGAATVLISTITSLILMYFVGKHLPGLPVINRLVLKHRTGDLTEDGEGLLAAMAASDGSVKVGQMGRTLTPLRPAGRVQIGDQIVDVVADMGFIDIDQPVRVVSVDRFRTVVEKA